MADWVLKVLNSSLSVTRTVTDNSSPSTCKTANTLRVSTDAAGNCRLVSYSKHSTPSGGVSVSSSDQTVPVVGMWSCNSTDSAFNFNGYIVGSKELSQPWYNPATNRHYVNLVSFPGGLGTSGNSTTLGKSNYIVDITDSPVVGAVTAPASLSLTGWWRAPFSSSPWVGTASADPTTAFKNLTEGVNPPAAGSPLNGLNGADFVGTNDTLTTPSAGGTTGLILQSGWSIGILCVIDSISTSNAFYENNDPLIYWNNGGDVVGISLSSASGGLVSHWARDTVAMRQTTPTAISTGVPAFVQATFDGSNIRCRVNGGAWQTQAMTGGAFGTITSSPGTMRIGQRTLATAQFFDGKIYEIITASSAITDGQFDQIRTYMNSRYGITV